MKVKDAKKMLDKFDDEQEIVLLDEARVGHDDAVIDFDIVPGFMSEDNDEDVQLEKDDEHDESCCVISFWQ